MSGVNLRITHILWSMSLVAIISWLKLIPFNVDLEGNSGKLFNKLIIFLILSLPITFKAIESDIVIISLSTNFSTSSK